MVAYKLSDGLDLLLYLIPPPQEREALTWGKVPHAFSYIPPFLLLAYLSRRARTHLLRLFLLPVVLFGIVHYTYRYRVPDRDYFGFEWLRTLSACYFTALSLGYALNRNGQLKIGEKNLPSLDDPVKAPPQDSSCDQVAPSSTPKALTWLPVWLTDTMELLCTMRGIGWGFGQEVHVPISTRPWHRHLFIKEAAISFLKHYLIADVCDSIVKLIPGVGSLQGGSIFFPQLSIPRQYIVSTAIHSLGGILTISMLSAGYELASLVGVGLLGQSSSKWPPIFDKPWASCSLHDFWGKGWHQLLRHTFLMLGGYPGRWLAGEVGFVLGSFLASGVYHQVGLQMYDQRVVLFFVLQGVGLLLERLWARFTGRRVGGPLGWLWTTLNILVLGQICMDAWVDGGLAGAILVPVGLSPMRRLVFPLIRRAIQS